MTDSERLAAASRPGLALNTGYGSRARGLARPRRRRSLTSDFKLCRGPAAAVTSPPGCVSRYASGGQ